MSRYLIHRISRRKLLGAAASMAAAASILRYVPAAEARRGRAIEVLVHDEVQEAAAFARGSHQGTGVRGAALEGLGVFESEVIASPFAFTHVGLHWRGNAARDARFELRTSLDGSVWSQWQPLHIEALPEQTPAGETFASLASAPRHGFVQYRASLSTGQAINRVTPTFLNSEDGPVIESVTPSAIVKPPAIDQTREDWGCDERLRFDRRGREIWLRMYVPVKKLIVHHTAGRNDYTEGEAAGEVRAVYTYHAKTLGWGDIGYNALVDRFGRSYEGRYSRDWTGGREVFGADVVAGHALAHNYGSSGAVCVGEYESTFAVANDTLPDLDPPAAMIDRLIDVLAYMAGERQIDPHGVSHYLLSDGTWNDLLPNVSGHKDCNSTACPGDRLYPLLEAIRDELDVRLSLSSSPVFLTGPDGGPSNPSQSTGGLSYSWSDGGEAVAGELDEYKYFLEGWHKASTSEAITYLTGYTEDKRPAWPAAWTTDTSTSYSGLTDGHYTMHVLRKDGDGNTYQADRTVLISGVSSGGGGKGGGKKPPRAQGVR